MCERRAGSDTRSSFAWTSKTLGGVNHSKDQTQINEKIRAKNYV